VLLANTKRGIPEPHRNGIVGSCCLCQELRWSRQDAQGMGSSFLRSVSSSICNSDLIILVCLTRIHGRCKCFLRPILRWWCVVACSILSWVQSTIVAFDSLGTASGGKIGTRSMAKRGWQQRVDLVVMSFPQACSAWLRKYPRSIDRLMHSALSTSIQALPSMQGRTLPSKIVVVPSKLLHISFCKLMPL